MSRLVWTLPDGQQTARWAEGEGGGGSLPYETGAGSPVDTVTPTVGVPLYIDTTNGSLYLAMGATDADWVALGPVAGNVGEATGLVFLPDRQTYLLGGDRDTEGGGIVYISDAWSQWNGHGQGLKWDGGVTEADGRLTVSTGATGQHVGTLQDGAGVLTSPGGIIFPSSDPHVEGAWWDNAGTLTRSAG